MPSASASKNNMPHVIVLHAAYYVFLLALALGSLYESNSTIGAKKLLFVVAF